MGGRIFQNLSFSARPPEPKPERAEPRLVLPNAPRPLHRPPAADLSVLSATRYDEPKPLISPAISPADRLPVAAARRPAGLLSLFAFAGFVALVVGGLAGIGFLQIAALTKHAVAVSGRDAAQPPADHAPAPTPPEAGTSPPVATAAIPGAFAAKPPPVHDAAPKPQVAQAPQPVSPSSKPPPSVPPALAALARGQGSGSLVSAAAATDSTAPPPPTHAKAKDIAEDHQAMSPPTGYHRPVHARAEPRHVRLRAAHKGGSPAPQSPPAQLSTPGQPDQAASFDRLVTQLTEPTKHGAQSLTPPPTGAPDPFARPASGE
jgi:hypothetical protein